MEEFRIRKTEDVATRMSETILKYLLGGSQISKEPLQPFDEIQCRFLNELSQELRGLIETSQYPDIATFAFWCRAANIQKLKLAHTGAQRRLGRGLVFHITPSNVPLNFAFSFAFGLLSGNANLVRVPTKAFPQTDLILEAIATLFARPEFHRLKDMTAFIRYEANDEVTGHFSEIADARVIWGGDETIKKIRKFQLSSRGVEIAFGDRTSLCVLSPQAVVESSEASFQRLAQGFYNDSYVMDQNACSSPQFVIWLGSDCEKAKSRFWGRVSRLASEKYKLGPFQAVDKWDRFCNDAIELKPLRFQRFGNLIYLVTLTDLEGMDTLHAKWGYFYEYDAPSLDSLTPLLGARCQTVTYFGVDKDAILDFVLKSRLTGVDRIVPVGTALELGLTWDGYDIINSLSRLIEVK